MRRTRVTVGYLFAHASRSAALARRLDGGTVGWVGDRTDSPGVVDLVRLELHRDDLAALRAVKSRQGHMSVNIHWYACECRGRGEWDGDGDVQRSRRDGRRRGLLCVRACRARRRRCHQAGGIVSFGNGISRGQRCWGDGHNGYARESLRRTFLLACLLFLCLRVRS